MWAFVVQKRCCLLPPFVSIFSQVSDYRLFVSQALLGSFKTSLQRFEIASFCGVNRHFFWGFLMFTHWCWGVNPVQL
ncbi:hypothetical protein C357_23150 [Citreicella sp. 357]|nr:hypothetical protein C357_23150 [Citreicella sp. 357]